MSVLLEKSRLDMKHAVLLCAFCCLSPSVNSDPPDGYSFKAFDEGVAAAQKLDKEMLIYFGRYGCGYCDKTNKEAFSDPRVHKRYTDHYVLVYVDSESGKRMTLPSGERITERELGTRYNAFVTPVFVFTKPGGQALLKRFGIQSADDLLLYDRYISEGHHMQKNFEQYLVDQSEAIR